MLKTKKVNARITPAALNKLQEIVKASGSSMSTVIMRAIEAYYDNFEGQDRIPAYEIAKQRRLIGCAKGPGDLSTNYKKILSDILNTKHGNR